MLTEISKKPFGIGGQVTRQFVGIMVVIIIGVAVRIYCMIKNMIISVSNPSGSKCHGFSRINGHNCNTRKENIKSIFAKTCCRCL